ncbi:uncharacterized protein [Euphorbia lathyris]|uniref:uncharacterized protein n=1 Tax=Euphorbia lathyris TaxID=212925 RepID=UPI00331360F2
MNATSISTAAPDLSQDNNSGSDSDTNTDVAPPAAEYYQPISSMDDDDDSSHANSDEEHRSDVVENGISSLHLNGDVEQKMSSDDEEEEEEEEEERIGEADDSAISRAFREDESRRNAPLSAENATRVREAMRGISFGGSVPDWIGRVPEDQWLNHLRGLRETTTQSSNFR